SAQTAPPSEDFLAVPQPILAGDVVCHVGVPVAAVVAETREQAADAAALIEVEWEELPSVAGVEAAVRGADTSDTLDTSARMPGPIPLVHPALGTNVAWRTYRGT